MASSNFKPRPAHELEAAGEPRWKARLDDGLVLVTDLASGEEIQATAYTNDGASIRFALPGDSGLREIRSSDPGFEAFAKVLEGVSGGESTATRPATAVSSAGQSDKKSTSNG